MIFRRVEVNSESILINSAGCIACGIFSIVILFFIGVPAAQQNTSEKICAVMKESRPYKMDVMDMDSSANPYMNYQISKRESLFLPIIIKAADKHNVDPALIKAIIMAESEFNPMATSKRGAVGLMQIMPDTATSFGKKDMYNPDHNINAGAEYLKILMNQFGGDLELTIAAYNAGSSKVREYQGIPPFETTRRYVKKVFEYYRHYQEV
jgi:soluble lytic murein transglycosylase-like protein